MIYYYFGSKEGLYLAVLEESYRKMRQEEADLHLEDLDPEAALRRLVAHTFERHLRNENYIRIVMSENIHRGEYLRKSQYIQELNVPAIARSASSTSAASSKACSAPGWIRSTSTPRSRRCPSSTSRTGTASA